MRVTLGREQRKYGNSSCFFDSFHLQCPQLLEANPSMVALHVVLIVRTVLFFLYLLSLHLLHLSSILFSSSSSPFLSSFSSSIFPQHQFRSRAGTCFYAWSDWIYLVSFGLDRKRYGDHTAQHSTGQSTLQYTMQ
jgi:hypothetical protein